MKRNTWVIIGVVFVFLLVAIVAFMVMRNRDNQDPVSQIETILDEVSESDFDESDLSNFNLEIGQSDVGEANGDSVIQDIESSLSGLDGFEEDQLSDSALGI